MDRVRIPSRIILRIRSLNSTKCRRQYSDAPIHPTAQIPPILQKIRGDMKAAMKAKDSDRLDILRSLIAETANAAKTSSPIISDSGMIALIRKNIQKCEGALKEFESAGRGDLVDKERAQAAVLEEYIEGSDILSGDRLKTQIETTFTKLKADGKRIDKGTFMKALVGPGGTLEGQLVDRKEVARSVDGMI